MTDGGALLIAVAVIGFVWIAARSSRAGSPSNSSAEAQLLRLCRSDAERADRLIELEMRRAPDISRSEAARRAVARYRHDNR